MRLLACLLFACLVPASVYGGGPDSPAEKIVLPGSVSEASRLNAALGGPVILITAQQVIHSNAMALRQFSGVPGLTGKPLAPLAGSPSIVNDVALATGSHASLLATFAGPSGAARSGLPVVPTALQISGRISVSPQGIVTIMTTPGTILNWTSFQIPSGSTGNFIQQGSNTKVLDIVRTSTPIIFARLVSNGVDFTSTSGGAINLSAGSVSNGGNITLSSGGAINLSAGSPLLSLPAGGSLTITSGALGVSGGTVVPAGIGLGGARTGVTVR